MSYSCSISFKEISAEEIMKFLVKFKHECVEKIEEIAKEECAWCPFIRKNLNIPDNAADIPKEEWKEAENWTKNSIFKFRYFYKSSLLGVYGVPKSVRHLFDKTVYFQNSCDQDYDFEEWEGIKQFENIYKKWMTVDVDIIKEKYNKDIACGSVGNDFDSEYSDVTEKADKLIYWRKSFCYEEIWKKFEDTLYNDDDAIYLSLFGYYDVLAVNRFVKSCFDSYKEKLKEFQNKK